MPETFDPYYVWLGIAPQETAGGGPNFYRLLGVPLLESNPRVIDNAADRQMAHLRTLQTGPKAVLAQRLLNEVAAARVTLLDPPRKGAYDRQLQARGAAPVAISGAGEARPATAIAGQAAPQSSSRRLSDRTISFLAAGAVVLGIVAGVGLIMRLNKLQQRIHPDPVPAAPSSTSTAGQPVLDFNEWSSTQDDYGAPQRISQGGRRVGGAQGGKVWAHFVESNRTPDYVELFDAGRHIWVRLTLTDSSWSRDRTNWQVTAHGGPVRSR